MRGGVDESVPWLALRSLAASRTGSKRLARGAEGLPPREEPELVVVERTARTGS
jgi:hypothetical protein